MFGRKKTIKEGNYVFSSKADGEYKNFIFGTVTGVDGSKIGVNGLLVNPVGLKNKISEGKAGNRSKEIMIEPTPDNCILALIYRTEHENFTGILDIESDNVVILPPKVFASLDGWIRESLPELINNVLSLQDGSERDQAKRVLRQRMDTLFDKNLKRNLYSVCRSLKILN